MSEADPLFATLRQSADADTVAAIERLVSEGSDRDLCRINPLAFAARHGLNEQRVISAFLHAARLGLFELSWNVLCPSCSGVLEAGASLKTVRNQEYCAFCAAGYEPTLDETVEVTFTVAPRVRHIAAHTPDELTFHEYIRQLFFGSGVDLPDDYLQRMDRIMLDAVELPAGEKAQVSLQLPPGEVILFDPVTHAAQFFDVRGEPTAERRSLSIAYGTTEVVMARLLQITNAKERVYSQAVSFFSTNESVLTALKASFTGMFGLHESTQTLNAMKEGVSKSLETLAEIGGQVQEEAVKAGYGPTIRADAVKKLVDSVITFQERSLEIVTEMRQLSTKNSAEIRDAVEDGKKRLAQLAADGNALLLETKAN